MAVIHVVKVFQNGKELTAPTGIPLRFRAKRETNLFYEVVGQRPLPTIPHVVFDYSLKESSDVDWGGTIHLQALLTVLTLGLVPMSGSYSLETELSATRSDGISKTYTAQSSGTATSRGSIRDFSAAWNQLASQAYTHCLNGVMVQMVRDAEFYQTHSRSLTNRSGNTF